MLFCLIPPLSVSTTFERSIICPLLRRGLGPRPAYAFVSSASLEFVTQQTCCAVARFEPSAAVYLILAF